MRLTHHYPAVQLPNGTHEIRDLDIFAECSRLNPHTGEVDVFDADWLRAAADQASARQAEGYLAPVHLGHHDPLRDGEPPFAGFLRDLRVDDGDAADDVAVLRATITGIPAEVFARIRDTRLPYRSVEIHSPEDPEINSLALLETTVPFFRFPITHVREEEYDEARDDDSGAAGAHEMELASAGVQFRETPDRHLQCVAAFAGASPEDRANLLLERVRETLCELRTDAQRDEPDASFAAREGAIDAEVRALASAGYVFSEPAVRALARSSTDPSDTFAALRETLPKAPLANSPAPNTAAAPLPADGDVEIVLREIGRRDDAARRAAEAANREFNALEPRFRAIGARFTRADFIRSRVVPVSIEHATGRRA